MGGFPQDPISKFFITIDDIHARIHQGNLYEANNLATSVAVASPKRFLIITPGIKAIHFAYEVESGAGGIKVELFEDTIVSANGTAIVLMNQNRLSSNIATLQIFEGPTVTADGTQIDIHQSGTTTSGGKISGHISFNREFILKKNTNYQMKITTLAQVDVSTEFDWYEVS